MAGQTVKTSSAIRVEGTSDIELINTGADCELLLLQAKPIAEPVVSYGPFVMNTRQEIEQAYADYRRTEFGGWPWGQPDPVHPRDKERFAIQARIKASTN